MRKEATKSANPKKKIDKGKSSAMLGKKPSAKNKGRKIGATLWSPPLNLVMHDALSFKSPGDFWISDSFYSHPLGYKLSLAVKVEEGSGDKNVKLTLALMSSESKQSKYLDFPCLANANVVILNPEANTDHESVSLFLFMLGNEDPKNYPDLSEQTEISIDFIQKGCLFFRVNEVLMDEKSYKLWLLDPKYALH